jgi:hypothetical protein
MATSTPNYTPLESSFTQTLSQDGKPLGFSTADPASLFTSTSFLYSLGIMVSVVAAGFMYARAGLYRMQASERGVSKSNEEIRRTTFGLLGILALFVIIYTFNKDLLTGDVGLKELKLNPVAGGSALGTGSGGNSGGATGGSSSGSGGGGASCADTQSVISSLSSQNGVCGTAQCTALSGCAYQQYMPIIQSKATEAGVSTSVVIAVMCKESKGNANAQNRNPNGTFDCGLMQVNQPGGCDQASLDPATNIARGIQKIQSAMSSASQVYQNIPQTLGAFASYNCCANGTVPNAPSADCTQASGFPFSIPKWACPINPGEGQFNMCTVKSYACDINACVSALDSM